MSPGPVQDEAPGLQGAAEGRARKNTAIVRADVLKKVEETLQTLRVPGITVSKLKGYGEYASFFRSDWMVVRRECAEEIARAIIETAHTGVPGDGLVVVVPVETVYRIRSKALATPEELG